METTTAHLLRQVSFFGKLDDAMLAQIVRRTRRRQFGPHAPLFYQGDPGETLYIIVSGSVAIQVPPMPGQTASGQTVHVA